MRRDGGAGAREVGGAGPDWWHVADALWLAISGAGAPPPRAPDAAASESPERPGPTAPRPPPEPPGAGAAPEAEPAQGAPDIGEFTPPRADAPASPPVAPTPVGRAPVAGRPASALRAPDPRGIVSERAAQRALRPFKRTVPSPVARELDEEATAERAADEGLWLPVSVPRRERWAELVLVVDRGGAMSVWRGEVARLVAAVERLGAFRDVRGIDIDGDRPLAPAGPAPLDAAGGTRTVLVVTDGIGAAWWDGTGKRALTRWARRAHVAVLHPLSPARWANTGLVPERIGVRVPGPGAPNAAWRPADGLPWPGGEPPVPLVALDAGWLGRWARMVAEPLPRTREILGLLPGMPMEPWDAEPEPSAVERVHRFRANASPSAFRLASRLAAAPLNRPVMEYVQRLHEPVARPGDLADILLGGLLRRVAATDPADETRIGYEFHPGVRELLLSAGLRDESLYTLRSVLDRLGRRWQPLHDIRDFLGEPSGSAHRLSAADELLPYVRVAEQVCRALSGSYLQGARTLGAHVAAQQALAPSGGRRDPRDPHPVDSSDEADTVPERKPPRTPPRSPPESAPEAVETPLSPAQDRPDEHPRGTHVSVTTSSSPRSSSPRSDEGTSVSPPSIWGNVPPRNPSFTGRGELLDALHRRLTAEGTAAVLPEALHGLGGVGKSQIALEYVHQRADDFDLVWWIAAERPEQIRQSLANLADRLSLPADTQSHIAVPRVLEALRTGRPYRNWLLVFDNAEDVEAVRRFFPAGGTGRILVTSRNARWAQAARTVEVDVFARTESVELLRRRGPGFSDGDADRVAAALGDLPLAIEQAAAWLSETGMPVDEYLQVFEDERADVGSRRHELLTAGVPVDYPEPVAAAWNMSLRRLAEHHPGALQLLQVCSFFAPEPISRRLFSGVRGISLPPELTRVLQDPIRLGQAIREINRYALMKINHRSNTIQMHRLVQAVLVGQMSPQQQADMRHGAHLLLAHGDPNEVLPATFPRYSELLSHARSSRAMECEDPWVRQMVANLVRYLYISADHEGCRVFASEVVTTWRRLLGEAHLETLAVSRRLGHALDALGHYPETRELNARTLRLLRESPEAGEDHEDTLAAIGSVANDARILGDFERALELNHSRWERATRLLGEEEPYTLGAANDYAHALRAVGDHATALRVSERARDTSAVVLGEDRLLTVLLATNVTVDVRELGDFMRARAMQEEVYAHAARTLPPNASIVITALTTLAVARRRAGDGTGALVLDREALERYRLRYSDPHLSIATTELHLAMDLRHTGDLSGAREVGEKSLRELREVLGERHPAALCAATDLTVTLRLLGEPEPAAELTRETLPVMREILGDNHPVTLVGAINEGSDHYALADFRQAHDLDAAALARCREHLGDDHPTTLACAINLSADLRALGEVRAADETHSAAVAGLRRVLGDGHPAVRSAVRGIRAECDVPTFAF
ncbi:FxSxx-COOH system tetratricopeptide repeat protein [Streptomyces radicis]|uniref:ATP/GTP-binding protein n=1 Tax=Streptomyces radicis TaxID=1750517 RepID=A0A3A9WSJ5_9ACTN|nr:FxSxx-COOH system tetratricopeptide repeat protein [Streptomyces radicis]RKN12524.1 ATP/GTP-binding protein [Streptomyces radicis]RKN27710.1 ATP/GTP-binding protein [Streptomyces radicis]